MPLCSLANRHGTIADMNWKLKICNAADYANITQSQACDTRHRQIKEVNNLFTDNGPLLDDYCIVAFQTIQPSTYYVFNYCKNENDDDDDDDELY